MIAPYSVVSLWDMLQISAHAFARATYDIGLLQGMIQRIGQQHGPFTTEQVLGKPEAQPALQSLRSLLGEIEKMEARLSAITVKRIIRLIESDDCRVSDFQALVEEVERRLFDELSCKFIFALDAKQAETFMSASFGPEVSTRFPSLIYEIDESYKCHALRRSTAAAFHAIRCLEGGFAAVWRCLGIADPISGFERNWGNRKKKVEEQIEKKWPAKSGRMTGDAKFFNEVYGAIAGMQDPYRNSTMHFDAKYTLDEAWHIMELVKGFMQKIASRMDEGGLPLA